MNTGGGPGFRPTNSPRYDRYFGTNGLGGESQRGAAPMLWAITVLVLATAAMVQLYRTAEERCPYEAVPAGEFGLAYTALIARVAGIVLVHFAWRRRPVGGTLPRRAACSFLAVAAALLVLVSYALLSVDLFSIYALHGRHSLGDLSECYGQA